MSSNTVPDLASVLQTLSSYIPSNTASDPSNHGLATSPPSQSHYPQQQEYEPHTLSTARIDSPSAKQNDLPNPSTITAWPAALKYVMKTVAQNESIQAKIRRLIRTQHDHENQWWEGRKALLAKHEARAEKKKKLDEVLRSIGGTVTPATDISTPEEDLAEIKNYDMKVYKASSEMAMALNSELRDLGIPFFAIQNALVRRDPPSVNLEEQTRVATGEANQNEPLTPEKLTSLQRRMLELLEDLCKE